MRRIVISRVISCFWCVVFLTTCGRLSQNHIQTLSGSHSQDKNLRLPYGLDQCHSLPYDQFFNCLADKLKCRDNGGNTYLEDIALGVIMSYQKAEFSANGRKWYAQVNQCLADNIYNELRNSFLQDGYLNKKDACDITEEASMRSHSSCYNRYGFCAGANLKNPRKGSDEIILTAEDYRKWLNLTQNTIIESPFIPVLKSAFNVGFDIAPFMWCAYKGADDQYYEPSPPCGRYPCGTNPANKGIFLN